MRTQAKVLYEDGRKGLFVVNNNNNDYGT